MYEVLLSKGKGKMTAKLERMFMLLAQRTMLVMKSRYKCSDDLYDVQMEGLYRLLKYWKAFDERKYDKAISYFTEIFKRGCAEGYNVLTQKKRDEEPPSFVRMGEKSTTYL